LIEPPLGPYNAKQIEFCLVNNWSSENYTTNSNTAK